MCRKVSIPRTQQNGTSDFEPRLCWSLARRSNHSTKLPTKWYGISVPSMPVKRWNFRKAKWSHYIALKNKFKKTLLPFDSLDVDAAYQNFCNTIKKPKILCHAGIEITIFRVGMQSVNPSINLSAVSLGRRLKFGCYSSACQA